MFLNISRASRAWVTVIFSTARNASERGISAEEATDLDQYLVAMCRAYLV